MCGVVLRPIDTSRFGVANVGHIVDMTFAGSLELDWDN